MTNHQNRRPGFTELGTHKENTWVYIGRASAEMAGKKRRERREKWRERREKWRGRRGKLTFAVFFLFWHTAKTPLPCSFLF
jgi:hypothetical protein